MTPILTGTIVRLEPLALHHAGDLFEASRDPRVWRWLPVVQPRTRADWDGWMSDALERTAGGHELAFATVSAVDRSRGRIDPVPRAPAGAP